MSLTLVLTEIKIHSKETFQDQFQNQFAWTTLEQLCLCVISVKLLNSLPNDLKGCMNKFKLKRM